MPRENKNGKKASKNTLSETILEFLQQDHSKSLNHKQIAAKIGVNDASSRNHIIKSLKKLAEKGLAEEVERGKYKFVSKGNYFVGELDTVGKGQGYVKVDELEEDIFIQAKNINKALPRDIVEVYVFKRNKDGKREGKITKIVQRTRTEYVGIIQVQANFAFVEASHSKMYTDIFIPKNKINNAKDGQKVLVEIEDWPENADSPYGKIIKIFGYPGEHSTEIHAILAQYGLPAEFNEEVENYANTIDTSIKEEEIQKRKDVRSVLTYTIDPKDAKDFDDALSFQILENGNYEIGVHIADVSHYVQLGTILDEEAYERGTSVYLVDRVVPMLPEILSNKACSLRPNEEKYTFSVIFEMNDKAEIISRWFGKTVSLSDAALSYEEAQHIIENYKETEEGFETITIPENLGVSESIRELPKEIVESVVVMDRLAKVLRKKRMRAGAISFDKVEVKFILDENNEPEGVYFKESKEANKLIEEFMLLANKNVAEFIGKQKPPKTFIYRIHDEPDDEKIAALENIIKRFGYKLNTRDRKTTANSLNKLLKEVQGKKEQNLIDTLTVRSMSKAQYTTHNIGHYGLAFDFYSHFTSPIRRYPDVMAHRLLQFYLEGGKTVKEESYEERCGHCNSMEILATNAERDSIKYMQVKYMMDEKDKEFLGVISGVTEWGIYVEIISNKCEGMVRLQDLRDDYYIFDADEFAVFGQKTNNVFRLGDEVYVKVKNADLVKKHLDFYLLGKKENVEQY